MLGSRQRARFNIEGRCSFLLKVGQGPSKKERWSGMAIRTPGHPQAVNVLGKSTCVNRTAENPGPNLSAPISSLQNQRSVAVWRRCALPTLLYSSCFSGPHSCRLSLLQTKAEQIP